MFTFNTRETPRSCEKRERRKERRIFAFKLKFIVNPIHEAVNERKYGWKSRLLEIEWEICFSPLNIPISYIFPLTRCLPYGFY
jgi:hypothetical protein